MDPVNVPKITDARFAAWDQYEPTLGQLGKLRHLLREERVDPAVLFGEGFSSLPALSRWGVSWGITYLEASREARWIEAHRLRVERDEQEQKESAMKRMIANHYRSAARHG